MQHEACCGEESENFDKNLDLSGLERLVKQNTSDELDKDDMETLRSSGFRKIQLKKIYVFHNVNGDNYK